MKTRRLPYTISGWGVAAGTISLLFGWRSAAVWFFRLVGLGGIGAVYGHYSGSHGLPVEPYPVVMSLIRRPDRTVIRAFAWHAVWWVLAGIVKSSTRPDGRWVGSSNRRNVR